MKKSIKMVITTIVILTVTMVSAIALYNHANNNVNNKIYEYDVTLDGIVYDHDDDEWAVQCHYENGKPMWFYNYEFNSFVDVVEWVLF